MINNWMHCLIQYEMHVYIDLTFQRYTYQLRKKKVK